MTNYTTRVKEQNFKSAKLALAQAMATVEREPGLGAGSRVAGLGWVKKTLTCLRCMSLFVMNFLVLILQAFSDMLTL